MLSSAHIRFLNSQRCAYQNISYEITKYHSLKKEQFKWMSLYFMSENQLKKVWNYLDENLKREFIKLSKLLIDYSILFILKKDKWKQLCINY